MIQMARNLSDAEDGFLRRKKFLVMDRDAKFSDQLRATLEQAHKIPGDRLLADRSCQLLIQSCIAKREFSSP